MTVCLVFYPNPASYETVFWDVFDELASARRATREYEDRYGMKVEWIYEMRRVKT